MPRRAGATSFREVRQLSAEEAGGALKGAGGFRFLQPVHTEASFLRMRLSSAPLPRANGFDTARQKKFERGQQELAMGCRRISTPAARWQGKLCDRFNYAELLAMMKVRV